jgi:hypothetical protein
MSGSFIPMLPNPIVLALALGFCRQPIYDIEEVQEKATKWLWHYNNERPNMGLDGITSMQKLKKWLHRKIISTLKSF